MVFPLVSPSWTTDFLKPIFKKGEKNDPDNYRGLAIGSAFAKLFSQILLNRLTEFVDTKNLLSPHQGGFRKGMSLIEKVVKKAKKRMFVAFIDFSKAYDTVNRDKLFDRLRSMGINGIFLKNIIAMYEKTCYKDKT